MFSRTCAHRARLLSRVSQSGPASMPLRARVAQDALRSRRMASSDSENMDAQADENADDVLFTSYYGLRTIELNRPKKLNSLNESMARKIQERLKEWEKSQLANVIMIKGAGRAFCAGGDVAALAKLNARGSKGHEKSLAYFKLEYTLDHLIATLAKPYVAFMDGITMGGGVGLSIHAPFRIATENTIFAMPETTIGFFPDVGASFFLPRMDGQMGTYLALTSNQLKGPGVFLHGVATHYIHSSSLQDLEHRLAELTFKDYSSVNERYKIINATIEEFVTGLPHDQPMQYSGAIRRAIDRCFHPRNERLTDIISALQREEGEEERAWAESVLKTLEQRSPTSLLVTLRQMRVAREWNIAEAFWHEYNMASHFMQHPDFTEGVTARLIEKRPPKWQPSKKEEVRQADVDKFFETPRTLQLLQRSKDSDYHNYPHAWIGLPTEREVEDLVRKGTSYDDALKHFERKLNGKVGVREKVSEVLSRKTRGEGAERLEWVNE